VAVERRRNCRDVKLALAGDTMLGRGVAEVLASRPAESLVAAEVVAAVREADLVVLNLECCVAEGGARRRDLHKPFFFRAPPRATELLVHLGVACVTLANNHALDYGEEALLETLEHLASAGIASVGAGAAVEAARLPAVLEAGALRLAVVGVTDHPRDWAATPDRAGVSVTDFARGEVPSWLSETIASAPADVVLVTPHWGPNMAVEPRGPARAAAARLLDAGAALVAGHSAHVVHGVEGRVLYDLGDFLDDYARDAALRNDLGLLWLVDFDGAEPVRLEALPLKLEYAFTRLADGEDAEWMTRRFRSACEALGTQVDQDDGRLVVDLRQPTQ
jgi:poly-gamma-glutamate capsule biosynthesis protein CapA/YwtB (metallophosphatase superfamily)